MSENLHHAEAGSEHHGLTLAQPDTTPASAVGVIIAGLAILLAITSYMLWVYFEREAEAVTHAAVLSKPSEALLGLRALENAELSGAAILEKDAGLYRVPVQAGASLFLKEVEARRRQGLPQRIQATAAAEGTDAALEETIP